MKNILFRADASSTIGTGHIMRDLVLAEQYSDDKIIFATQELEGNLNHKIIESAYDVVTVDSNSIDEVNILIKEYNIDMIVIDHYGIDYNYEKALKEDNPALTILSFDDTYEKHYCDILLNHNIYADKKKYHGLVPENCELRCGSKYTLLRKEFLEEQGYKQKIKKVKNIFIAMGGADSSNLNLEILKTLSTFTYMNIVVVTTEANQHLYELKEYAIANNRISLYINASNIAQLMVSSDLAIVTPSVTLNEIFFLKIPFISVQTADNQKYMVNYIEELNLPILREWNIEKFKIILKECIDGNIVNY